MKIGRAVVFLRTMAQLTQVELAEMVEISSAYVSLIEREKRDPTIATVAKIASALGVSLGRLIQVAENMGEMTPKEYLDSLLAKEE